MVVRADLNGHLKALKDYFLLAKGDFFQVMMENVYFFISLRERKLIIGAVSFVILF